MRTKLGAAMMVVLAAGCAGPTGQSTARSPAAPPPSGGASFLSVVGTPFYLAFKLPVCLVTVAIAAPTSGAAALAVDPDSRALRTELDDDVSRNCGPPYALQP